MRHLRPFVKFSCACSLLVCGMTSSSMAQDSSDTKQLTHAFLLDKSQLSEYAKSRNDGSFYVQLNIQNLRQDLQDTKCVDASFLSWIRKFFKKDAKTITLVASITMPDGTLQKIPLFEISMDEQVRPPKCLTNILTSEPITPLFVARRGGNFQLDVQALVQQNATITTEPAV